GWASVLVFGPGLGQYEWGRAQISRNLTDRLPLVLDADGLNWLAQSPRHQD
ncbi:NAD(P)H-hydrate dehydratase, partial [Aeromonas veronii]|uniref:NAD(P)H-hydrate dehydratase n=1 Tax=Aeromonas veronii TaxID=654 RepID=UPI0038B5671A